MIITRRRVQMNRRKKVIVLLCLILLIGVTAPLKTTISAGQSLKIGSDNVNIRKGPGLSYPVIAKVKKGEHYPYFSEKEDWIEIQLYDGSKGWVANWLVHKENSQQKNTSIKPAKNTNATVSEDGLRVRKGPDTSFQVIGTIQKGQSFAVVSVSGNWTQLKTPFGDGWVSSEFVQVDKPSTKNESVSKVTDEISGQITADSLNIRNTPSLESNIIGKLHAGDTVKIISQNSEWTEISYSGQKAWISSQFVQVEKINSNDSHNGQASTSTPGSGKVGIVTATSLTVRNTGSLNGKAIASVSKGQSFKILEEVNNWAKIEYKKGSFGWIANWYLNSTGTDTPVSTDNVAKDSSVTILHDGSNIRKSADTQSQVVQRANQGDSFNIISVQNDWYEIRLTNGETGFVAGWIVSVNGSAPPVEKTGSDKHIKNKKIVIDPGHGGRDNGTTGASGTIEKTLTLRTAQLLYDKLTAAGADVTLTRSNDTYIPLSSRVYAAHYQNADAFISLHYDSINDRSIRGMTTYYYHPYQKNLANNIHSSAVPMTNLKDRSYRQGDYYVLRENKGNAVLMELGYLSNPAEEMLVTSSHFQEAVTSGISQGLVRYFKNN